MSSSSGDGRRLLVLIDNYDSFSHNLVQLFGSQGHEPKVFRNDQTSVAEVLALQPAGIIISPGPGRPERAGISIDLIREALGKTPLLGICLGHQCLATVFGADVIRGFPMHGKSSSIHHDGEDLLRGIPSPFGAARYHSLVVDRATIPQTLRLRAWTPDGAVMALSAPEQRAYGVQFHPESFMTTAGQQLADNFISLCGLPRKNPGSLGSA